METAVSYVEVGSRPGRLTVLGYLPTQQNLTVRRSLISVLSVRNAGLRCSFCEYYDYMAVSVMFCEMVL